MTAATTTTPPSESSTRSTGWPLTDRTFDLLVAAALLAVAAAQRASTLPGDGLWFDDAWVATGALHGGLSELAMRGSAHPGFTLMLQGWDAVIGGDPWTLAVPAFVASVLGPPVVYLGLRHLGFARSVAGLLGAILVVAEVHVLYAGRVKSYTMDTLVVMVLAVALPALAARRWTWRTAAVWVVVAVCAASLSGYQLVATALAVGILILHSNRDRGIRVAAAAVQGILQGGMYLAARSTTDLDAVEAFMETTYDGHLSVYRNPITMAEQVLEHLGRIVDVYPGGPRWLLAPLGCLALGGLIAAAMGWRRGRLAVTAQFLLLAMALAFVGGIFNRFPFGPSSRNWSAEMGSPGSRHSLWLVPVMVIGLAVCLDAARSWWRERLHHRPVLDLALPLVAVVVLAVSWSPQRGYMAAHSLSATRFAEDAAGPDDLIITIGPTAYLFASATDRPMVLEPTPQNMVGFSPVGADGHVVAMGEWANIPHNASAVRRLADGRDRVVIVGTLLGPGADGTAVAALTEAGFEVTDTFWEGNATVNVLDRVDPSSSSPGG